MYYVMIAMCDISEFATALFMLKSTVDVYYNAGPEIRTYIKKKKVVGNESRALHNVLAGVNHT